MQTILFERTARDPRLTRNGSGFGVATSKNWRNAVTFVPQVIDVAKELGYWRDRYRTLPGGRKAQFNDYAPAIKLALDAYIRSRGRTLQSMQPELQERYARVRESSRLEWPQASAVVEMSWKHLFRDAHPG